MLFHNDPLRDIDTLFNKMSGLAGTSTMPMDAYRRGNDVWLHVDLPGVPADTLDLSVERNVLTISAERSWQREEGDQPYLTERPRGSFRRQIHLGDGLDVDNLEADYTDGVLTVRIPVAEQAQPRKISIGRGQSAIDVESSVTTS